MELVRIDGSENGNGREMKGETRREKKHQIPIKGPRDRDSFR